MEVQSGLLKPLPFLFEFFCAHFIMTIIVFIFSRQQKTIKSFSTRIEYTSKSVPEACLQDPQMDNTITGYFALTSPSFGSGLCCVHSCFSSFVSFYFISFLFFYLPRVLKRLKLYPKTGW